ncbi:hypothetical protein FMM54_00180 [Campylobacter sp. LR185c]|uniref:hypothetical protein n=1 Tax=Campylobacter sp. LR185c TaxID=2014525 RepID=UPI001237BF17|nr:hypothetical protein [Campylobacter sp. LR185c]KAA6228805.1 hypothetical protein FMM54_00180 [Campylobacter sp. LR185c]KAA8604142.1 hypothetical protein CGP82_04305 [Campylobacter sp. LR185c]
MIFLKKFLSNTFNDDCFKKIAEILDNGSFFENSKDTFKLEKESYIAINIAQSQLSKNCDINLYFKQFKKTFFVKNGIKIVFVLHLYDDLMDFLNFF